MEETIEVFKALSSKPRMRIIEALKERPLCVNALAMRLGMRQSAISQHLRILRAAGLVKGEKQGYWVHYSLDGERLGHLRGVLGTLLQTKDE
jgi:DNA-binding transcriptional ArsR family regulator